MRLLCYNDYCCVDGVINKPDAIVIHLEDNCDIHGLLDYIPDHLFYNTLITDLEEIYPMSNFKEVYSAIIDNAYVEVIE